MATERDSGGAPAVFLDRDGVLNRPIIRHGKPYPPATLEELEILPGVVEACAALHRAGLRLIVVTNQPDIRRGTQTHEMVDALNGVLKHQLALDDVRVCPHDDADACSCRKPAPGLLLSAAEDWGIALERSVMVGDRWRDIETGKRAGCSTVLVGPGYAERRPEAPDLAVQSLAEAVPWILQKLSPTRDLHMPIDVTSLKVKIFADGADRQAILELAKNPLIRGFTTNPTLMRKAGVVSYESFAKEILKQITDRPISFEVFSDEFPEMESQAMKLTSWGNNVYVKIPVTNTRGESSEPLIGRLAKRGVKVNATALLTLAQVQTIAQSLAGGPPSVISVFAGRIADTGVDPLPIMKSALETIAPHPNIELLWASPREVFNIAQASAIRCHIITVTPDLLNKLPMLGRDLGELSLDTVRMFYRDAAAAGYSL